MQEDATNSSPVPSPMNNGNDADLAKALEKLKSSHDELREKFLSFREKDILELRHEVKDLSLHFKLAMLIGAVVIALIGAFGFKQFGDLTEMINKTLSQKIDDSLSYYDQVSKAILLSNNGSCPAATALLTELAAKRPDDEIVFGYLTNCLVEQEEYNRAFEYISDLKAKNLFPRRFQSVISLNNAGYIFFVKSLTDASLEREARDLLMKADKIGTASNSPDLKLPLSNLVLLNISQGKEAEAALYAKRYLEIDGHKPDWKGELTKQWFLDFEKKRPSVRRDLEFLFPGSVGETP